MRPIYYTLAALVLLSGSWESPPASMQAAAKPPAPTSPPANLLVNGSFEEGPEIASGMGFDWYNEGSTDLKGWTVSRGQISYVGEKYWQHADGKRSLDMHGGPGFGGIKQTFATKKGQRYRLIFSLAGNPDGPVPIKTLGVKAAGAETKFTFDCSQQSRMDMGWLTQVWDFTAIGEETTLELFTLMTEDPNCGPALDNVSVTPVED